MKNIHAPLPSSLIEAEQLKNYIGQTIAIHGMIYHIREMANFSFVILRTKQALLQCIYSREFSEFSLSELKDNMSLIFTGKVIAEERSRTGVELQLLHYQLLSAPSKEAPVVINQKKVNTSLQTLLDYRPLTLRNASERAIFQIQSGLCEGFRKFFKENRFTEIHSPKLVFSGAEGGANIFKLDYFGQEAYLTQSPQFYKQAMVGVFERVYEIAPVFRAEKHDTARHINEYTSVDFEMGFIQDFYELMSFETKMLKETLSYLEENYKEMLSLWNVKLPDCSSIPALPFEEAKELISKTYHREIIDFYDFDPEEEKLLCEIIKKQTGSEFVFVTHYKSLKRPFYAMDSKENPDVTESFDLLFRGMEITTGGQRIHDYHEQVQKLEARNMNPESFSSYLMAHQYGLPPHGGLGLGLERFTAKLLNFSNVRLSTLFPRDIHRLTP